jgi:hypothetical protein
MNQAKTAGLSAGITEETRREFVANCYRLGFPVGVVLTKILGEISDIETLREFMDEELSIRTSWTSPRTP